MFKKLLLTIALALSMHLGMSAAYAIVINRSDGTKEAFMLEKKPVVTFDATDLIVNYNGATVAIAQNEISDIEFSEDYSGIASMQTSMDMIEFIDAGTVRISNSDAVAVSVYDLAGRKVSGASVASDGSAATVSIAQCPSGVYLITYNNKSFKLIKK